MGKYWQLSSTGGIPGTDDVIIKAIPSTFGKRWILSGALEFIFKIAAEESVNSAIVAVSVPFNKIKLHLKSIDIHLTRAFSFYNAGNYNFMLIEDLALPTPYGFSSLYAGITDVNMSGIYPGNCGILNLAKTIVPICYNQIPDKKTIPIDIPIQMSNAKNYFTVYMGMFLSQLNIDDYLLLLQKKLFQNPGSGEWDEDWGELPPKLFQYFHQLNFLITAEL